MAERSLLIDGVKVPRLVYGTAWKKERTEQLAALALQQGFRGIDTANQRKHYHEAGVGQAIRNSLAHGLVTRDELFVQSKYTFRQGQDHRLPYDPSAPIAEQVEQSFVSSLQHLGLDALDSYLLHGPIGRVGLTNDDWAAWRAMENVFDSGRVRHLGVSNVEFDQLRQFYDGARIKPRFVQNRCYAVTEWDRQIREFCADHALIYQGFSLLTANLPALHQPLLTSLAERHGRTTPQIVFRFALQIGMIPLTGTSSVDHMREDLDIFQFRLKAEEIEEIEQLAAR